MSKITQTLRKIECANEMKEVSLLFHAEGKKIGFVPTMGALHAGHFSLLEKSLNENDITICSIYVNPTQFTDKRDFENYPITLNDDLEKLKDLGVDVAFCPTYAEMYPDSYRFKLTEAEFSRTLCGEHRPDHFDGVLTIVMKLFQIVQPKNAYFGEKDYQQLLLIQDMANAFFLDVTVVPCPTLREVDGLAMSSRNRLLKPEDRAQAPVFFKALKSDEPSDKITEELKAQGFEVDYVQETKGRRFGAVKLGNVRLIDNVEL